MSGEPRCTWCGWPQSQHRLMSHLFTLVPEELRTKGHTISIGWPKVRYGNIATAWKHVASNYRTSYNSLVPLFTKQRDRVKELEAEVAELKKERVRQQ